MTTQMCDSISNFQYHPLCHLPPTPSSPNSNLRHRVQHALQSKQQHRIRSKPYHRPSSEFQSLRYQTSPCSPFTPTSLSSSSSTQASSILLDTPNAPQQYLHVPPRQLQRADSAPELLISLPPDASKLQIPIFAKPPVRAETSPLVFSNEFIDAHSAKYRSNAQASSDLKLDIPPYSNLDVQFSSSLAIGSAVNTAYNAVPVTAYGSAYVDSNQQLQAQLERARAQKHQDIQRLEQLEKVRATEEKRQKYAMDLIESAIRTIYKIWPDQKEPDSSITSPIDTTPHQTPQPSRRRRPEHQQFTPDSSPDAGGSAKKRKRDVQNDDGGDDDDIRSSITKRRSVSDFKNGVEVKMSMPSYTIPSPLKRHQSTPQPQHQSQQITLKMFVRELLRRSKTSCNTLEVALCYLDGIEETVKKLRDCMKLGIAFGTAAMAERGPYDEGMKDEGRIIMLDEWLKLQQHETDDGIDVRGEWSQERGRSTNNSPISPFFETARATTTATPTSQVLATHPLLDARRTFLASLVLATKFIQDKAYSNKAWAKLSGLGGREVGRCERALGGALQWRLWVGKECSTPRSPISKETLFDRNEFIHGSDDPLAKQFVSQVASLRQYQNQHQAVIVQQNAPVQCAPANCSRARTWPLLNLTASLEILSGSSEPTPTNCSPLADRLKDVHLQIDQPQTSSRPDGLQISIPHLSFTSETLSTSPEDLLEEILRSECPETVKMSVDDAPFLSMNTSFGCNEPGLLDCWTLSPTSFPFTFTIPPPAMSGGKLLHPQTAALRSNSGSSGSSSSTFSSPEVLTPINSRASTLVDGSEYAEFWKKNIGSATASNVNPSCAGQEFQRYVNHYYTSSLQQTVL